jgi:hypothetical protein
MRGCSTVVMLVALGCSDGPGDTEGSGGAAGAPVAVAGTSGSGGSSAGGAMTGGASGAVQGGSSFGGSSSGTAGASGSVGASGGAAVVAADLLPLADGNNWTYSAAEEIEGCTMANRLQVSGPESYEGRMAYRLVDSCSPDSPSLVSVNEGRIEQFSKQWDVTLGMPLAEGTTWQYSLGTTFKWQAVGTVTVPAGTFENCWKRVAMSQANATHRTYCPGVGRVLDERGEAKSELVSYELH